MKTRYLTVLLLISAAALVNSCRKNNYRIDVSSIEVEVKAERLEKDLFTTSPDQVIASVPLLREKYDGFLQLFSYVINTGDVNEPSFGDFLVRFCSDKQNNEVYGLTMKKFPDLKMIEDGLTEGFRHYLYYFPKRNVPKIYTCITGFNNSIITGDSALGIGLDRYLGADCEYYPRLNIYKYIAARMTPENIVPDCFYGWGVSEWDFSSLGYRDDNVLAEIIHEGKLKYFEKCMLPEISDEILFGFTAGQLEFCRNNESQMWQYLVENNLLFSTDQMTIRKLTGEAPFTSYFSKESPGRAAVWLGFRIVESYMLKTRSEDVEGMLDNTDIQNILEKARYNPR